MAFFRQLRVILWKNIVVYSIKRHYFLTFFTMAIPLLLASVLVYLRSLGNTSSADPIVRLNATIYPEFKPDPPSPLLYVVYTPNTTYTNNLMNNVFHTAGSLLPGPIGFPTEDAMDSYIANQSVHTQLGTQLAVIFGNAPADGSVTRDLSYTFRFNNTLYDFHTALRMPMMRPHGPRSEVGDPYKTVFWGYQGAMFTEHVKLLATVNSTTKQLPEVAMHRMPYPEYNDDSKFDILSRLISMFVVYGYLVFAPIYVRRMIQEKSSRIRELMRMMGLSDWVYWIGTFASGFLVLAVTMVISLILFKVEVAPMAAVLLYSDFSLLVFIMLIYATAAVMFMLLFTVP